MTIENISWSISTKECCQPSWEQTCNLLITSQMHIQLRHRGHRLIWIFFGHTPEGMFSPTFAYMRKAFSPCEKLLSHMITLVLGTIHLRVGEKESIMSQSMQDREISPSGRNFNQGLGKPRPWLKFLPSREISLSCMDTHDGFLYSHIAAHLFNP